ncbi:hypothetical protein C0J52_06642 [Blattella germanica]|nr:hypothetical protein C0J52_06642 [Blattella germanica]
MEMGRPCHTAKGHTRPQCGTPALARGPKADRDVDGQICSKNMQVVNGQDLQGIENTGDVWNTNCASSEQ